MIIDTKLSPEQFFRLFLWQHFNRKPFYFYAITAAIVTSYALMVGPYYLLALGWLPFIIYISFGMVGAWQNSRQSNNPVYLPTQYSVTPEGIEIKTTQNQSTLSWADFSHWKVVANCYVLALISGPVLVISKVGLTAKKVEQLEGLLHTHIKG